MSEGQGPAPAGAERPAASEVAEAPAGRETRPRSPLRAVTVPAEHGGWGLTLEPVLLGLLLAPTIAGACIGLAAVVAFLARTPLKVLLVDAHRGRELGRTRLARRVFAGECVVLVVLAATALVLADSRFWIPLVVIGPLLTVELWFDMRSRSRRLIPELAGAIGIGGVAAVILLAGGRSGALAVACWLILAARSVTAIVSVRDQVGRIHGRPGHPRQLVAADLAAVSIVAVAVAVDGSTTAGAAAVLAAIAAQRVLALRPTSRAVVLGLRQTALGLAVVTVTVLGVLTT